MSFFTRKCLSLLMLLAAVLPCLELKALHIVGGEITYDCLGDGSYEIRIDIYRDCAGIGAPFDNPAYLHIYDASNNLIGPLQQFLGTVDVLPVNTDICVEILPTDICVEHTTYTYLWDVPPGTSYPITLAYLRYSRNSTIQNLVDPDLTGSTYLTTIPEADPCNNSAVFNDFPPVVICTNNDIFFDHGATDLDGDSLVYELCTPLVGGDEFCVQPGDPFNCDPFTDWSPPYPEVTYVAGFDAQYPLPSDPAIAIDSETGLITGVPTALGQYVIAVCVSEYRDGELINTVSRDFQFNVAECSIVSVNMPDDEIEICAAESYTIEPVFIGADNVIWEPADNVDNPNSFTPTVTEPGLYTVTASNLEGCDDTASILISFLDVAPLGEIAVVDICSEDAGDGIALEGLEAEEGWTIEWEPAELLDDASAVEPIASIEESVEFSVFITTPEGCESTGTLMVNYYQSPANTELGSPEVCTEGESVTVLLEGPEEIEGYSYEWSPAELVAEPNNASTEATIEGSEAFELLLTSAEGCTRVLSTQVTISELVLELTYDDDPESCTGEPVLISAMASEGAALEWQDASSESEFLATTSGTYSCTATKEGCEQTVEVEIIINTAPEVDLGPDLTICEGGSTSIDASQEDAESYLWQDDSESPVIEVLETGSYAVTVTYGNGCVSSDEVKVDLVDLPSLETDILLICEQEEEEYLVHVGNANLPDPAASYVWSDGSTENSYLVTKDDEGWIWVDIVKDECQKRDSLEVQVYPCTILPLEMLSFTGDSREEGHWLEWTTASEYDVSVFQLEKSYDASSFELVQNIPAKNEDGARYSFLDAGEQGACYYRLRIQHLDASYSHSSVIWISEKEAIAALNIHPIPAKAYIMVSAPEGDAKWDQVRVLDISGRVVLEQNIRFSAEEKTIRLDLSGFVEGVYLLELWSEKASISSRFLVR